MDSIFFRILALLVFIQSHVQSSDDDHERGFYHPNAIERELSHNVSSVIQDVFCRQVIMTELLYCPGSYMCSDVFRVPVPDRYAGECCLYCSCDVARCRLKQNCCPTLLLPNASFTYDSTIPLVDNNNLLETSCIYPQVLPPLRSNFSSDDSYIMIQTCPKDWSDDQIREQCQRDHFLTLDSSKVNVPVSAGKNVYKSKACSICNGQNSSQLAFWDITMQCSQIVQDYSLENIKQLIFEEEICNMIFKPPYQNVEMHKCNWGFISECNITGLWKVFDANIERGCQTYTSVYRKTYRNVFCYLCNGGVDPFMSCPPDRIIVNPGDKVISFSALLDFISDVPTKTSNLVSENDCKSTEMFDDFSRSCLAIKCEKPTVYVESNKTCKMPLNRLSDVLYKIYLEYNSTHVCDRRCWPAYIHGILSKMDAFLQENGFKPNTCSKKLFNNYTTTSKHFIATTSFFVDWFHDFKNMTSVIFNHFLIPLDIWLRPGVKVTLQPYILDPLDYSDIIEISEGVEMVFIHDGIELELVSSTAPFSIKCHKEFILSVDISQNSFCPCVILPAPLEIIYKRQTYVMQLPEINVTLDSKQVKVLDNSEFCVCLEAYKAAVKGRILTRPQPTILASKLTPGILSLVCTCISIVCLIITITTYSLFESLRTAPGRNNLSLAVVLLIANILDSFSFHLSAHKTACMIAAILTHFFWLCVMAWMNVCCIHMYVVFRSIHTVQYQVKTLMTYLKYVCYSIVAPCLFITANLIFSHGQEQEMVYGGNACFLHRAYILLYTFALPIGLVIVINMILFLLAICKTRHTDIDDNLIKVQRNNILIYAKLSTVTGFSWIFGFLHELTNITTFSYLFISLTASQGLFIMLAFVCNRRVANLYRKKFKNKSGTTKCFSVCLRRNGKSQITTNNKMLHQSTNTCNKAIYSIQNKL